MNATDDLVNAVIKAEFNSVNAGYNGTTAMQVADAGELKRARLALAKDMEISLECDLFEAALKSQRNEQEQWIAGLCYAK